MHVRVGVAGRVDPAIGKKALVPAIVMPEEPVVGGGDDPLVVAAGVAGDGEYRVVGAEAAEVGGGAQLIGDTVVSIPDKADGGGAGGVAGGDIERRAEGGGGVATVA